MLKTEADRLIADMQRIVKQLLHEARLNGHCQICYAERGEQHSKDCYVWPLIQWRSNLNEVENGRDL